MTETAFASAGNRLTQAELAVLVGRHRSVLNVEIVFSRYMTVAMGPRWLDRRTVVVHPRAAYAIGWTDDPSE